MAAEENKEEQKQEPAPKAEEKPKKVEKHAEPAATAVPAAGAAQEKKGKKISRMTLAEVEEEIKTVKEKMGGFQSAFARNLLARQKELKELATPKK